MVAQIVDKIAKFLHLGIAKLTETYFPVFLWITFCIWRLRNFFLGIMGFLSVFLLLHPPLFEIEAQCKEK